MGERKKEEEGRSINRDYGRAEEAIEKQNVRQRRLLPDVGRRVLEHAHGLVHLQRRYVEALSNVLGHAKRHVGPGEAGEEVPHLQDTDSTLSSNIACKIELLKSILVHCNEGLHSEDSGREKRGGEEGDWRATWLITWCQRT